MTLSHEIFENITIKFVGSSKLLSTRKNFENEK